MHVGVVFLLAISSLYATVVFMKDTIIPPIGELTIGIPFCIIDGLRYGNPPNLIGVLIYSASFHAGIGAGVGIINLEQSYLDESYGMALFFCIIGIVSALFAGLSRSYIGVNVDWARLIIRSAITMQIMPLFFI